MSKIEATNPAARAFSDSAGSVFMATGDSLEIRVHVDNPPPGLSFVAYIDSSGARVKLRKDTVQLYDDGRHGDSLAADGLFANWWRANLAGTYVAKVSLTLHDTLHFDKADYDAGFTVDVDPSINDGALALPQSYLLEQNYPNPFNPSTTIKYTIGGAGGSGLGARDVELRVYDVLGREVAVLVNERKPPGRYEVTFDASRLASGVYFYRMQAGDFVQTRKLLLVR
jgi:hypothetical protein